MKWTTVSTKNGISRSDYLSKRSDPAPELEQIIPDPQHWFQVEAARATKLSPVPGCFFVPPQCAVTTRVTDTQLDMMKWDRVKTFYAGQGSGDTPCYAALHGTQLADCFAYVSHGLRLNNSCSRPAHLLVLGEAGVGKTTFLNRLALRLASSPSAVVSRRLNCVLLKGKRPEVVRKKLDETLADLRMRRPALLILDSLDSMLPDQDASNAADDSMSAVQSLSLSLCELLKRLVTEDLGVVVAASALSLSGLHEELRPRKGSAPFLKSVILQNPSREERQQLINNTFLGESSLGPLPEEFLRVTESFSVGDLERFTQRLKSKHGLSLSEARLLQEIHTFIPLSRWGRPLRPEVQKDLSMVGALGAAKAILTETLVWPSTYRAIYRKCLKSAVFLVPSIQKIFVCPYPEDHACSFPARQLHSLSERSLTVRIQKILACPYPEDPGLPLSERSLPSLIWKILSLILACPVQSGRSLPALFRKILSCSVRKILACSYPKDPYLPLSGRSFPVLSGRSLPALIRKILDCSCPEDPCLPLSGRSFPLLSGRYRTTTIQNVYFRF
jgi:hypothetical protein